MTHRGGRSPEHAGRGSDPGETRRAGAQGRPPDPGPDAARVTVGIDDSGRVVLRAHDGETRERLDERLRDGLHADLVSRMPGSPRVLKHVLLITIARGFEPHVAYDIGIRCVKSQDPVPFD